MIDIDAFREYEHMMSLPGWKRFEASWDEEIKDLSDKFLSLPASDNYMLDIARIQGAWSALIRLKEKIKDDIKRSKTLEILKSKSQPARAG